MSDYRRYYTRRKRKPCFSNESFFEKGLEKKFRCSVCKNYLSTKNTLKRHILVTHIKLRPHVCDICNKHFIFEKTLNLHKESHWDESPFKCSCGKCFKTISAYYYHKQRFHKSTQTPVLGCSFCHKKCLDKKQLRYHLQTQHFPKTIPCEFPTCKRRFSTRSLLSHHLKSHSEKRYQCSLCDKSFKLESYLAKHKAAHTGTRPFKCPDCDKSYLTLSHVNTHWKRTHSPLPSNYLCAICGKLFKNKYELDTHENIHKEERPFKCNICSFASKYSSSLRIHKRKHSTGHESREVKTLSKFTKVERGKLKKNVPHYIKIPSGSRPFKCSDCDKSYPTAVRANEHWRRYHLSKPEFRCSLCHKLFQNKQQLENHKDTHEEEEIFGCNICNFKTAFRIGLFAHMKNHSNDSSNFTCKNIKAPSNMKKLNSVSESGIVGETVSPLVTSPLSQEISDNLGLEPDFPFGLPDDYSTVFSSTKAEFKGNQEMSLSTGNSLRQEALSNLKNKNRLKKGKEDLISLQDEGGQISCWEDERYELSHELILENKPNSLDIGSPQHCNRDGESAKEIQLYDLELIKNPKFNIVNQRRNPKITLNSTAIDDSFE